MAASMKGFCVFLCLLTLALHLSSSQASKGSPAASKPAGITPQQLSFLKFTNPSSSSPPRTASGDQKTQGDGKKERPRMRGDQPGELVDENGEEGLIYNVDYHGVITHPSPLPRHPNP